MTGNSAEQLPAKTHKGLIAGLAFVLMLAVISLFVIDRMYHPEKFRIEQVEVNGQFREVDGEQVKHALVEALDGNYLSASLENIEQHIRKMPWVYDVSVRRKWPSTLVIDIDEVQPIAKWGETQWLNANGDLVGSEKGGGELPRLFGPEFMQHEIWSSFQKWHGMFAAHGLSLDRLKFDERELWYLTLSLSALALDRSTAATDQAVNTDLPTAEVTMIVDHEQATARIQRLINALNSQLIADFPSMKSIDLRYPNGFAIDWVDVPEMQKLTKSN